MRTFIDKTELVSLRKVCAYHKLNLKDTALPGSGIVQTVECIIFHANGKELSPEFALELSSKSSTSEPGL